jgi:Zn-dependent peptidase ImmA (M78 family)
MDLVQTLSNPELESLLERLVEGIPSRKARARPSPLPEQRAESICDYFAACVLMPRVWIKRDFGQGIQTIDALARRYQVSTVAMRYRLEQLGLYMPAPRCAGTKRLGVVA